MPTLLASEREREILKALVLTLEALRPEASRRGMGGNRRHCQGAQSRGWDDRIQPKCGSHDGHGSCSQRTVQGRLSSYILDERDRRFRQKVVSDDPRSLRSHKKLRTHKSDWTHYVTPSQLRSDRQSPLDRDHPLRYQLPTAWPFDTGRASASPGMDPQRLNDLNTGTLHVSIVLLSIPILLTSLSSVHHVHLSRI
jgi:hypothetical protein